MADARLLPILSSNVVISHLLEGTNWVDATREFACANLTTSRGVSQLLPDLDEQDEQYLPTTE